MPDTGKKAFFALVGAEAAGLGAAVLLSYGSPRPPALSLVVDPPLVVGAALVVVGGFLLGAAARALYSRV